MFSRYSRVVSCVDKTLLVSPAMYERYKLWGYPSQLNYRSKCLTLWQTVLGVDVFIYGVYVQVGSRSVPTAALTRKLKVKKYLLMKHVYFAGIRR